MSYPYGQPTQNFSQDPSMPPGYPEDPRGVQQMQDPREFQQMQEERRMPESSGYPGTQCQEPKKRKFLGFELPFGGGKRKKRTKRKRSKRRKSRRS